MYGTLRNEIDQLRGKNNSPNKLKKSVGEDSTLLVNEIETLPTEKITGILSNNYYPKTKNQKSISPVKRRKNYGIDENKYVHCEYRHPGTFVKYFYQF
jgi:hypothetical protein